MGSGIIMMSRTSIFLILGACIVAGLLVAGCTQQQAPAVAQTTVPTVAAEVTTAQADVTTTPAAIGMANPASVNCGKIGGTTEIKAAADGSQYGICTFPNGTSCEEWALFRNEGCMTNVTVTATTNVAIASTTPATAGAGMNVTAVNTST